MEDSDGGLILGSVDLVWSWHGNCSFISMKQQTLAMAAAQNTEFERYCRPTRRDQFLATME